MATILDLVESGKIVKLDAGLSWREQEQRCIYILPRVREWLEQELPNKSSSWNIELSPIEQLDAILNNYCSGRELTFERQINPIRHISLGIWEIKTADLRIFGWFYKKDIFICSHINIADFIKEYKLYNGLRDESCRWRNDLELDEPKFVAGDNPNDVISAFNYPAS